MKIFISWSGPLSKSVAEKLRTWLRQIIQVLDPFVSSYDIQKGNIWLVDLLNQLDESDIGIVCVSRESLNSDWLLFESGALAKHVGRSKVCTLLIDISPVELSSPLSNFQATTIKKEDVLRLILTIHSSLDTPLLLKEELITQFNAHWDDLYSHIKSAIENPVRKRNELQELVDELLLPVIYREARDGELDTVFHWLQIAQRRKLIDLESTLGFVEATLARVTGKRGAGRNLQVLSQNRSDHNDTAYVEMLFLKFSAQETLHDLGDYESHIDSLQEQSMLTASAILGMWNLREKKLEKARNFLNIFLERGICEGPYDRYRAIPLGILSFSLGYADFGEKYFDLAKNSISLSNQGYPFISLTADFDRAFVNACIGIKEKNRISDIRIREFKGHAWVLVQYCEILKGNEQAIDGLISISAGWPNRPPLQKSAVISKLTHLQKSLIASSGAPSQS